MFNVKALWNMASGFVSGHLLWFKIGGIVLLAGAIGTHFWLDGRVRTENAKLKGRVAQMKTTVATALSAQEISEASLLQCRETNAANEAEAIDMKNAAERAAARIAILEAMNDRDVADIEREAESFQTELGCPALTVDFRAWLRDE